MLANIKKMKLKLFIILLCIQFSGYSQNIDISNPNDTLEEKKPVLSEERSIRIGLKFGVPNLIGLNFEYVTTALNNKLALVADLSYIPLLFETGNSHDNRLLWTNGGKQYYFEFGSNYYLIKKGKSMYAHLSYGFSRINATYNPRYFLVLSKKDNIINTHLINIKCGAKWGNSFYFRPEIGYAINLGKSTTEIEVIQPASNSITYKDEPFTITKDIPAYIGGLTLNVGFGIAF
jgi:hypothetical protein